MGALDIVTSWPVTTAAVAVVDHDGVVASTGPETALPWASVTKPLTALTMLVSVGRGEGGAYQALHHLLKGTEVAGFSDPV